MKGYDKLSFIDKIRYWWRVRQKEKLEDIRQRLENYDDRQSIDKQKIINELLAERENKKNKAKALPPKETVQRRQTATSANNYNKLNQYKVPTGTVKAKSNAEMIDEMCRNRIKKIVERELIKPEDAYENIIEIQRFLSYPHDNTPEADMVMQRRLNYIQQRFGQNVLTKGMKIYAEDKMIREYRPYFTEEEKIEQEIINNPKLAEKLNYLRYNPEAAKKEPVEMLKYRSTYSAMIETQRTNDDLDKDKKQNESKGGR